MQVALLFLVRHHIPTEPIWTAFMASAAELTLKQHVAPTAPAPPPLLPSSREYTGPTPTCDTYIPPQRSPEPLGMLWLPVGARDHAALISGCTSHH